MNVDFAIQNDKKIRVNTKTKTIFIEISKITHIICDGYLSAIYTIDSDLYIVSKLLKHFERELEEFYFVRANRSTLVNLLHVKEYNSGLNRSVELVNNIKIGVSRRRVFVFRNCNAFE